MSRSLRFKSILEGIRVDVTSERMDIRDRRKRLDESMRPFIQELTEAHAFGLLSDRPPTVEEYRAQEQKHLAKMNRKPMTVKVTPTAVRIEVRFQVRFEGLTDKQAQAEFPKLKTNFETGVRDTWNQTLTGAAFSGRAFEVLPELTLVSAKATRDPNFWLISVRPTDTGPMVYEGTKMGVAPGGTPTSATDPLLDGGVMSIPPLHAGKPDVLGHELLHLLGMVDRYMTIPASLSTTKKTGLVSMRETKGRKDPLGGQGGKILEEDLGFVLEEFGAYSQEERTTPASAAGMSYGQVLGELKRVQEIIDLGYDPNSLIPIKKDFRDEMIKQAEDID
jgi:hypothetical protein